MDNELMKELEQLRTEKEHWTWIHSEDVKGYRVALEKIADILRLDEGFSLESREKIGNIIIGELC